MRTTIAQCCFHTSFFREDEEKSGMAQFLLTELDTYPFSTSIAPLPHDFKLCLYFQVSYAFNVVPDVSHFRFDPS